jgi:hypothetical protein
MTAQDDYYRHDYAPSQVRSSKIQHAAEWNEDHLQSNEGH